MVTNMYRLLASLVIATAAALLLACDPAYPLFVRNGLVAPVFARVTWETGVNSEFTMLPGERVAFLHSKGEIIDVVVLQDDRPLLHLDRNALLKMQSSVPDMRKVTWNIQADGIVPLTEPELDRLLAGKE